MMTGTVGVDTSFLIDFFRGDADAIAFMKAHSGLLRVSEIVIYEFLCGNLSDRERKLFLEAMQSFPGIVLSREAVFAASNLFRLQKKKGRAVGHQDCLIAGSYLTAGISSIVTRNEKHFASFSGLAVLSY
jgi:predicted nucleic acid-binding protein